MSWVATGITVGSAALGAYQQGEQQKAQNAAQRANMFANAAAMEYSPWTGMGKDMVKREAVGGTGDVLGAGLQSGLQGYLFGKQFGQKKSPEVKKPLGLQSGLDKQYVPRVGPANIRFPGQDPNDLMNT